MCPFGSVPTMCTAGRRFVAVESNRTNCPALEITGSLLGPLPCACAPQEKLAISIRSWEGARELMVRRKTSLVAPLRSFDTPRQRPLHRLVATDSNAMYSPLAFTDGCAL